MSKEEEGGASGPVPAKGGEAAESPVSQDIGAARIPAYEDVGADVANSKVRRTSREMNGRRRVGRSEATAGAPLAAAACTSATWGRQLLPPTRIGRWLAHPVCPAAPAPPRSPFRLRHPPPPVVPPHPCAATIRDPLPSPHLFPQPDVIEGLVIRAMKPVGAHLLLNHQLSFSRVSPPFGGPPQPTQGYSFGAILVPGQGAGTMLRADVDGDLNVSARGAADLGAGIAARLNLQLARQRGGRGEPGAFELSLGASRDAWNARVLSGSGGYWQAAGLAKVWGTPTQQLAVGGEAYWVGVQRTSGAGAALRWRGKLLGGEHSATLQASTAGAGSVTWRREYGDRVALWSQLDVVRASGRPRDAVCTAGYDAQLRMARLRGSFDTRGMLRVALEERVAPGVSVTVSAEIDHARGDHRFGLGLSSEPVG